MSGNAARGLIHDKGLGLRFSNDWCRVLAMHGTAGPIAVFARALFAGAAAIFRHVEHASSATLRACCCIGTVGAAAEHFTVDGLTARELTSWVAIPMRPVN